MNKAAGEVVGASQSGKEQAESEIETIDFSKMSYTQAKKIEMDAQVCQTFSFGAKYFLVQG